MSLDDYEPFYLQLPYSFDDQGNLVAARRAAKGDSYYCPGCQGRVILKRGDVREAHFAHSSDVNCASETALHKIAKRLISDSINLNASTQDHAVEIEAECEHCGKHALQAVPPGRFTAAAEEVRVGDYWCDVVGYRGSSVALALEIRHTHKIGIDKASKLQTYWVELDAEKVISNPLRWESLNANLEKFLCDLCKKKVKATQKVMDRWHVPRNLYSAIFNPKRARYIGAETTCWKCKASIPVFWWRGVPFAETTPPEPRPQTIQFRYSKQYGGKYWVNTCPQCKATQGDNFLFLFEDAPLQSQRLPLRSVKGAGGSVSIETGPGAVDSFLNTIKNR